MAAKNPNPFGKDNPDGYPELECSGYGWRWQIRKLYKTPANSVKDPYARAFCAVTSPHTYGSADLGDVYINDIPGLREKLLKHMGNEVAKQYELESKQK
jgi:hypothetical protein